MAIFAPDDPPVVAVEDTEMFEVSPTPKPAKSGHIWKKLAALCSKAHSRTPLVHPASGEGSGWADRSRPSRADPGRRRPLPGVMPLWWRCRAWGQGTCAAARRTFVPAIWGG